MNPSDIKTFLDPVCGMTVPGDSKNKMEFDGKEYFFCSKRCWERFEHHPAHFTKIAAMEDKKVVSSLKTYFPLILVSGYLIGIVALLEIRAESFDSMRMMNHFMAGFFIVFSFFKMLDLKGFASAYQSYDWVAQKFPIYGFVYPFLELGLGVGYLLKPTKLFLSVITILIMGVSTLGVIQSLVRKKEISCACLGTVFQFPMSKVTLFEDLLMLIMALVGLIVHQSMQ